MQFEYSNRFIKDYKNLDPKIQDKIEDVIQVLGTDRFYPGLKTKKVQGIPKPWAGKVWEAYIDGSFRITYHLENDTIVLRRCGTHQIYDHP